MNLCSLYELDENKVLEYLEQSKDKNYRAEGYRYEKIDGDIHLLGWQYTNIKYPNNKIKLYTFLNVIIDEELNIKEIKLSNNFKGSQGTKCNSEYLNKHINEIFLNEKLSLKNKKIKDYKLIFCRHIYELLYGMCNFIEVNTQSGFYYEKTTLTIGLSKIKLSTYTNLNNKENNYSIKINNLSKIKLDNKYNIIKSNNNIETYINNKPFIKDKIISNNNIEFYQNTLKYIFKYYQEINNTYELNNSLSFSVLFPTSLYSLIVQLITVYKRIYDKEALNKCIKNFQIIDGEPICLGFKENNNDNI